MFLKLAWRNIWRNQRRTFIMIGSISFAILYTTFTQSNKLGLYDSMIESSVNSFTGYIQVHKKGFWEDKSIHRSFHLNDSVAEAVKQDGTVKEIVPRLEAFALVSSGENTRGSMIVGVDPEKEEKLTELSKRVVQGEYLNTTDRTALVGTGLAKYLKKEIGDTLYIIGQGYRGTNAVGSFIIKGIIEYPSSEINDKIIYLPLASAQYLFGTENKVTGYCAVVDKKNVAAAQAKFTALLDAEKYEVMDWQEMLPDLVQSIAWDQFMIRFIYIILYLIVGFGIFATFYMMVNERQYEFGIIIASGMKRAQLKLTTYAEVVMIAITGTVVGCVLSFMLLFYLYNNPIRVTGETAIAFENLGIEPLIRFSLASEIFYNQASVILGISLLVGTYALRRISKIEVVTAIRE